MFYKKKILHNKVLPIILIGILISISFSFYNIKKFNIDVNNNSPMIKADLLLIWREAESFKNDINKNKGILYSGI